jgi:hypothetical protein
MMLLPFWLIRVPRVIVHTMVYWKKGTSSAPKEGALIWVTRELTFRKWSSIAYFPLALSCQAIAAVTNYCRNVPTDRLG